MRTLTLGLSLLLGVITNMNVDAQPPDSTPIWIVVNPGGFENIAQAAAGEAQVDFRNDDLADDDACTECFAAVELRRYLAVCLNIDASRIQPVWQDRLPAQGAVFVLGNRRSNPLVDCLDSTQTLDTALEQPDSYRICAAVQEGRTVCVIEGRTRAGTLYGVYDYLERLGMRFYGLGEQGTVYPASPVGLIGALDTVENPAFLNRGFYAWEPRGNEEFFLWMARNRMNYWTAAEPNVPLLKKLGMCLSIGQHDMLPTYLNPNAEYPYAASQSAESAGKPADPYVPSPDSPGDAGGDGKISYFEAHPEWFGLLDGKRNTDYTGGVGVNFCTSNADAVTELTRNVTQGLIDGHWRDGDIVNFWMVDGGKWCECERCRALGTPTDRLLLLLDQVNRAVQQARRDGRIQRPVHFSTLAYSETIQPPSRPLPPDFDYENCSVTFYPIQRCYTHPLDDPRCTERNLTYAQAYKGWVTGAGRYYTGAMVIGEYYNVSNYKSVPVLYIKTMAADIPWYYRNGARYFQYMHTLTFGWGTWTLNQRLLARLLWNPKDNVDQILSEYYLRYYPTTSSTTARFYDHLEKAFSNVTMFKSLMPYQVDGIEEFLKHEHLHYEPYHPLTNDALDVVEIIEQIELARKCLDQALLECSDSVERARLLEDARRFDYGESMCFFNYHMVRLLLLRGEGKTDTARYEWDQLQMYADRLTHVPRELIESFFCPDNGLAATSMLRKYEELAKEYGSVSR